MASVLSFFGRLLFGLLFISSGVQKLLTYEPSKGGGPVVHLVTGKLETFLGHVNDVAGVTIPLEKEHHQYLLLAAVALELLGGALFILDFSIGAVFLMLFLVGVTPVIHDFWNVKDASQQQLEAAQFFKNVALAGALLFYLGRPTKVKVN